MGWTPPTETARTAAVAQSGERGRRADRCPTWLCDCALNRKCFAPKSPLQNGDWLSGPGRAERAGQSFAQYQRQHNPRRRATEERKTIVLVPVGDCTGVDSVALAAVVNAWFGLPVVLVDAVPICKLRNAKPRSNDHGQQQIITTCITDYISRHCKPPSAFCTV
eukprot:999268-Prymnesium_polylepis.1